MSITVYLLAGPTASGKTALSLPLARLLNAEILVADSRQVYRRMDIGTAKPTAAERAHVPHHGLDLREPDEVFSAAEFVVEARRVLDLVTSQGKSLLIVGGTGMYIKALQEGWDFGGIGADQALRDALRDQLESAGLAALAAELLAADPAAAELVDLQNPARVLRALEIIRSTGRPLTQVRGTQQVPWEIRGIVLARPAEELAARIQQRLHQMIHEGWLDEVRELLAAGPWPAQAPALTGIGYAELARYLAGELQLHHALELAAARTRQYAKRQRTWFRAQSFPVREITGEVDWVGLAAELALTVSGEVEV